MKKNAILLFLALFGISTVSQAKNLIELQITQCYQGVNDKNSRHKIDLEDYIVDDAATIPEFDSVIGEMLYATQIQYQCFKGGNNQNCRLRVDLINRASGKVYRLNAVIPDPRKGEYSDFIAINSNSDMGEYSLAAACRAEIEKGQRSHVKLGLLLWNYNAN